VNLLEIIVMKFEIGKYYKHSGGGVMHIIGAAQTTLYGWCLVAEEHASANLKPVGCNETATQNWAETTEKHWMSGFRT